MIQVIRVDGSTEELASLTLEKAQKIVGGYVESFRLGPSRKLLMNEEGRIHGLPTNFAVETEIGQDYSVVGDVILLTGKDTRKW